MQVQPYQRDDRGYEIGRAVMYGADGLVYVRTGLEAARRLQRDAKAALRQERRRHRRWWLR